MLGSRVLAHLTWLDPLPINLSLLYITWEEYLFINNMLDNIMLTKEPKEDQPIYNIRDNNLRITSDLTNLPIMSLLQDITSISNLMEVHLQYRQ